LQVVAEAHRAQLSTQGEHMDPSKKNPGLHALQVVAFRQCKQLSMHGLQATSFQ